jgi:class 3 adenylate cyclase
MSETRKLAAILVSDVVGYSRLAGADEDRILARLRTLRSDLIDPLISVHHGRIVKRTGDGSIIEFRSVVDAVRCAIEVQRAMAERNAEVAPDKRIDAATRRRGQSSHSIAIGYNYLLPQMLKWITLFLFVEGSFLPTQRC